MMAAGWTLYLYLPEQIFPLDFKLTTTWLSQKFLGSVRWCLYWSRVAEPLLTIIWFNHHQQLSD